jgi:hypothetical protein
LLRWPSPRQPHPLMLSSVEPMVVGGQDNHTELV